MVFLKELESSHFSVLGELSLQQLALNIRTVKWKKKFIKNAISLDIELRDV